MGQSEEGKARRHAEDYHRKVYEVSIDIPLLAYTVWSWEEMPEENKAMLYEASRRFLESEDI